MTDASLLVENAEAVRLDDMPQLVVRKHDRFSESRIYCGGTARPVIHERADARQDTTRLQQSMKGNQIREYIWRRVQEETRDDCVPAFRMRLVDLKKLSCAHRHVVSWIFTDQISRTHIGKRNGSKDVRSIVHVATSFDPWENAVHVLSVRTI